VQGNTGVIRLETQEDMELGGTLFAATCTSSKMVKMDTLLYKVCALWLNPGFTRLSCRASGRMGPASASNKWCPFRPEISSTIP